MIFLDACLSLFFFYAVTQWLLPFFFPNDLKYNWLFKRKKKGTTSEQVATLTQKKAHLDEDAQELVEKTTQQLKDAEELNNSAKNLKN